MKKILLMIFISFSLNASDLLDITLKDYVHIVSKINNINIIIDKEIDDKITLLINRKIKKGTYFYILSSLLDERGFYLLKANNYYIIKKKQHIKPILRSIKLQYINYEDIKQFLSIYKDIKYEYISTSKLLIINSKFDDYFSIKNFIKKMDILPKQLKLKVTIIETNIEKLKEFGIENKVDIKSNENTNFFYNLVAFPFTVSNKINQVQSSQFYSFIKLLNHNNNTKLISSPILTISDNQKSSFEVVTNIAYKNGEAKVDNDNSKVTTAYAYKDVGLKLNITPKIYESNVVYLDLELTVSNIINSNDNLPTTSKKYIKQNFHLKQGNLFVLTGINRNETTNSFHGIPLLMDIPVLGWLFKYESQESDNINLSIVLEVLDENEPLEPINEVLEDE